MTSDPSFRVALASDPQAPARARAEFGRLEQKVPPPRLRMIRLLVSELVTNSVRHGSSSSADEIYLDVALDAGILRVAVTDRGQADSLRLVREPDLDQEGGRGLWLVARLSDRWGIDEEEGTHVWFEVAVGE